MPDSANKLTKVSQKAKYVVNLHKKIVTKPEKWENVSIFFFLPSYLCKCLVQVSCSNLALAAFKEALVPTIRNMTTSRQSIA